MPPSSILLLIIVVGLVGFFGWRRYRMHQYHSALSARGWNWIAHANPEVTVGLNHAPFGLGFNRSVSNLIGGHTSTGVAFQAFNYASDHARPRGMVVVMPLPKSLPPLYVNPRAELTRGLPQITQGPLTISSPDQGYSQSAFRALSSVPAPPLPGNNGPVQLSIDHANLVLFGASSNLDALTATVEWMAGVREGLITSSAMNYEAEPAPDHLSFEFSPAWHFIQRDDAYLNQISHTSGGFDHQAHNIILAVDVELPFIRLEHHWKTREKVTDAQGRSRTRIKRHQEILCEFVPTFPFLPLSFNWGVGSGGQKVTLESAQFNKQFKVRAYDPRFAHDVLHPRQMEYLLSQQVPPFCITGEGNIFVTGGNWYPAEIQHASQVLTGFFDRVPRFVWDDLGVSR